MESVYFSADTYFDGSHRDLWPPLPWRPCSAVISSIGQAPGSGTVYLSSACSGHLPFVSH